MAARGSLAVVSTSGQQQASCAQLTPSHAASGGMGCRWEKRLCQYASLQAGAVMAPWRGLVTRGLPRGQ